MRAFFLSITVAAFAGCGTPIAPACAPACAAGFTCDSTGACVSNGTSDGGGGGDMAVDCAPACGGLTPRCNAAHHCVACTADAQCPMGSYCNVVSDASASCVVGCMSDDRCAAGGKCCGMRCVDPASSAGNCGMCGNACTANHAQATCAASQCTTGACDKGWGDCNKDPKDGCEANLHLDVGNCTACGMQCALANAVQGCADGCYIKACQFGWGDCNQNTADGCEASVLTDPANCGACAALCNGLPNAQASCTAGNCVLGMCNAGYANCDGDPKNGCEANLLADAKNCSACGVTCPVNAPSCSNGVCGTLFTFQGVMNNVAINSLGGWTECFRETYGSSGTPLATVMQKCPGSTLLMGCRATGAATLLVAAQAPRADVLFDTGQGNVPHDANGVGWYYSTTWSMGFAKQGDPISRNSCDTANQNPDQRICWHTGGGNLNGGYRCGAAIGLNGDNQHERILYTN